MHYYFNTEWEIKLETDVAGLDYIDALVVKKTKSDLGHIFDRRVHVYFDTENWSLAKNGLSFRRVKKKPSYCFKYPLQTADDLVLRREVFTKCDDFELEFSNYLHQRTPVLSRLMSRVEPYEGRGFLQRAGALKEVLIIEYNRKQRIVVPRGGGDRIFALCLEVVTAFNPNRPSQKMSWCEAELETVGKFAGGETLILKLAKQLKDGGLIHAGKGKYRKAVEKLYW